MGSCACNKFHAFNSRCVIHFSCLVTLMFIHLKRCFLFYVSVALTFQNLSLVNLSRVLSSTGFITNYLAFVPRSCIQFWILNCVTYCGEFMCSSAESIRWCQQIGEGFGHLACWKIVLCLVNLGSCTGWVCFTVPSSIVSLPFVFVSLLSYLKVKKNGMDVVFAWEAKHADISFCTPLAFDPSDNAYSLSRISKSKICM